MRRLLGTTIAAVLAFAATGLAQTEGPSDNHNSAEHKQDDLKPAPDAMPGNKARRLESVSWNSVQHRLTWVITDGVKTDSDGYKPENVKTYRIDMDKAIMLFNGERRHFSNEEAASVHALMDLIAKYAVESTLWWDAGQGEKLEGASGPRAESPLTVLAPENMICMLHPRRQ